MCVWGRQICTTAAVLTGQPRFRCLIPGMGESVFSSTASKHALRPAQPFLYSYESLFLRGKTARTWIRPPLNLIWGVIIPFSTASSWCGVRLIAGPLLLYFFRAHSRVKYEEPSTNRATRTHTGCAHFCSITKSADYSWSAIFIPSLGPCEIKTPVNMIMLWLFK
jgi:hypothetical protein